MVRAKMLAASITATCFAMSTMSALAQRPSSGGQSAPEFSLTRAWNWLTARPGVMVALAIVIVAIGYMVITRDRSKT